MFLKIIVFISVIGMLLVNFLANSIPFGGNTTGDISDKYPTMFTPAGFTFSIWGIIYLLVILFSFLIFVNPEDILPDNNTFLYLVIVLNVLNATWLYCWHHDWMLASTIVIIGMLVTLLVIISILPSTLTFTFITFSIYAGWISVATIANISILIYKFDIGLFMKYEAFWFYAILIVGLGVGIFMAVKEKNYAYAGVIAWAYFGILAKYIS